ncbi:LGFP repeat-containing protein, partial [Corynebacterium hindlerae]
MLATVCFNPIPAHGQEIDQSANETVTADISQLRHPAERDIYDVDTSDWDFSEPGMNKNNIDNHYYEHALPTDLGEPQPEIIDGQMRSDRIALPGTVTKHEADQAEVMEAKEQQPQLRAMTADNCRTYWPRPHQVCGAIKAKYESLAVAWAGQTPLSFLGLPKSGELTNPDGVGKRTEFDNGFIYWHPDTGAWSVTTHNSIVWARNGWEQGRLGYPTSDEIGTGDGVGRKQMFQRGRIYTSLSGVVSIEGKILEKWIETGEEKGPLGYPATDEEGTPDGVGRF